MRALPSVHFVRFPTLVLALWLAACRSPSRPSRTLPTDPVAWVPSTARALVVADLTRLRQAPSLARWMRGRAGEGCAARLSEGVTHAAVVATRADLDEFALVLTGSLPAEAVVTCARATNPRAAAQTRQYRGVTLVRLEIAADAGARDVEVDLLPNGVALLGPAHLVRSLLDAGISRADGERDPLALRALWDPLPRDAAIRAAARLDGGGSLPFAAVRASARAGAQLALSAHAETADEERAVELAHEALQWRQRTLPSLQSDALRGVLSGLRVRAVGRAVEAELSLDASHLEALWTSLSVLATDPSPSPPTAPGRP